MKIEPSGDLLDPLVSVGLSGPGELEIRLHLATKLVCSTTEQRGNPPGRVRSVPDENLVMADEAKRTRAGLLTVVVAGIVLSILVLRQPAVYSNTWEHDVSILLDAAQRIHLGQVAHQDFHTPLGVFTPTLVASGFSFLEQPNVLAVPYSCLLLALLLMPVAWFFTRERVGCLEAAGLSLFLGLLVLSPRPLGIGGLYTLTYAMLYNRHGEALLGLFTILVLLPPRQEKPEWPGLALAGFLFGLLFFLKLNYWVLAVAGLGLRVLLLLLGRKFWGKSELSALLLGSLAGALAILLWSGASARGYLGDLSSGIKAQEPGGRAQDLLEVLFQGLGPLTLLLACVLAATSLAPRSRTRFRLLGLYFVGGGMLLGMSNCQGGEMPLWSVGGLVVLESSRRLLTPSASRTLQLLSLFALIAFLPTLGRDLAATTLAGHPPATAYSPAWTGSPQSAPGLKNWFISSAAPYRLQLDSGIRFIAKNKVDLEHTFVANYLNPYPFAMGQSPPRHTLIWWHLTRSVSARSKPSPEDLFQETRYILIPRGEPDETRSFLFEQYRPYWSQHFEFVKQNSGWRLLRRKGGPS